MAACCSAAGSGVSRAGDNVWLRVSSIKAGLVITQSYCRKLLRKVHNILHVQLTKLNVAIVLKGFRIRMILLQMPSGYIVCTNVQMMRPEGENHVQFRLNPF